MISLTTEAKRWVSKNQGLKLDNFFSMLLCCQPVGLHAVLMWTESCLENVGEAKHWHVDSGFRRVSALLYVLIQRNHRLQPFCVHFMSRHENVTSSQILTRRFRFDEEREGYQLFFMFLSKETTDGSHFVFTSCPDMKCDKHTRLRKKWFS